MTDKQRILNSWKDAFDLKDTSDKLAWMNQYVCRTDTPKQVDFSNLSLYNDKPLSEEEIKNLMPLIRKINFGE